jgi:hypothetical protein
MVGPVISDKIMDKIGGGRCDEQVVELSVHIWIAENGLGQEFVILLCVFECSVGEAL